MKCKNCGKEFTRTHPRQKHCSYECRMEYNAKKATAKREKERAKNPIVKTCIICGNPLKPTQKKCCSPECSEVHKRRYEAAARQRKKEEREAEKEQQKKEEAALRKRCKVYARPTLSIAEVNELARREGLNYGQYCAKYGL